MRPAPAGKRPMERRWRRHYLGRNRLSGGTNSTSGLGGASPTGGTSGIGGLLAAGRQDRCRQEGRDRRGRGRCGKMGGAGTGGAGTGGSAGAPPGRPKCPCLSITPARTVQRDLRRRHSGRSRRREFARPVLAGERHAHDDARRMGMPARRISAQMHWVSGPKAPPSTVTATLSGSNLSVVITPGSADHPLGSTITTPSGAGHSRWSSA
jgi:hypothetical protein